MCPSRLTLAGCGLAMLALSGACSRPEVLTPEAAKARGDAMLKQMSDSLAKAQTFSYRADQAIDRIGPAESEPPGASRGTPSCGGRIS